MCLVEQGKGTRLARNQWKATTIPPIDSKRLDSVLEERAPCVGSTTDGCPDGPRPFPASPPPRRVGVRETRLGPSPSTPGIGPRTVFPILVDSIATRLATSTHWKCRLYGKDSVLPIPNETLGWCLPRTRTTSVTILPKAPPTSVVATGAGSSFPDREANRQIREGYARRAADTDRIPKGGVPAASRNRPTGNWSKYRNLWLQYSPDETFPEVCFCVLSVVVSSLSSSYCVQRQQQR